MADESEGSKSSSTQEALENLNRLIASIKDDIQKLLFSFPQFRGLKHKAFIIGVLFENDHLHTIHPNLTLAHSMIKRMEAEIAKRLADSGE
jgi:GTP1/Obg family GTP-binding protein